MHFSNKQVHLPIRKVIVHGAQFPALRAKRSEPTEQMTGDGEVNAANKPSERKDLQMQNYEAVMKIDK